MYADEILNTTITADTFQTTLSLFLAADEFIYYDSETTRYVTVNPSSNTEDLVFAAGQEGGLGTGQGNGVAYGDSETVQLFVLKGLKLCGCSC